ncbi:MAG: tRNA preQ1(34) S-adenosylmethionine ribosyltransferase-isomerase QueA [bacterium]|nr:tRNA preQ1(34) S-adenosylmethionine ribosyltransferase-isomerase QueA [bacterium]
MPDRPSYLASRLDYELPPELIAQQPAAERGGSRLLHVDVRAGGWHDRMFSDLPELLPERTVIYFNDSRVIPARMHGKRKSGGAVELLYLEYEGDGVIRAIVGSNAKLLAGEVIQIVPHYEEWTATLLEQKALDGVRVQLRDGVSNEVEYETLLAWLLDFGELPLPPYISPRSESDGERYQTVYAGRLGSVAAPTAGLHFTEEMLQGLRRAGHATRMLTLHVGIGTFAPLRVEDLKDHVMHEEPYSVGQHVADEYLQEHAAGTPVVAVGTTSLRILHTLLKGGVSTGRTSAFIYPGHGTDAARMLLTNFHLPRSTLLALVYAFGGEELMRNVYAHAVREKYRFFSYGDCMLIDRGVD